MSCNTGDELGNALFAPAGYDAALHLHACGENISMSMQRLKNGQQQFLERKFETLGAIFAAVRAMLELHLKMCNYKNVQTD